MNAITACRALLGGATLFAATAMATPDAAQQSPASPCLSPARAAAPPAQQEQQRPSPHPWRGPCYLADADKADDKYENEGASATEARQRVDEIMELTRSATSAQEEHQLTWLAPQSASHQAGWQPLAEDGPGSWMLQQNPMYRVYDGAPLYHDEDGIPAVPEPGTVLMLITGLLLIGGAVRRQRTPPFSGDTARPAARQ